MNLLHEIKTIFLDTYRTVKIRKHFEDYTRSRLECIDKTNIKYTLPKDLEREYIEYYKSFGFKHISTVYVKFCYALTGVFDKRIIPDDIFNLYIDPVYPEIRDFWQNKSYHKILVPTAKYPNTIVRNVNGYFIDNNDDIITEENALELIKTYGRVVIKPTIRTGGGLNVRFYDGKEVNKKIFEMYEKDFLVQEKIKQGSTVSQFNENAVCTDKIVSFMHNGEVYISHSVLRVAGQGAEGDNITTNDDGCAIRIYDDGRLNEYGRNKHMNKIYETFGHVKFADIKLDFHKKCIEIIKKSHLRLLHFPVVSWDFAEGEDGEPILIEYNMKWHELLDCQIYKPFLGDMTEEILKEAAETAKKSKSLL